MESRAVALSVLVLLAGVSATAALDSRVNPANGQIESVEAVPKPWGLEILHVVDPGKGAPTSESYLTANSVDDLDPRIEIDEAGRVWVAYWRDGTGDEVWLRFRDSAWGAWGAERRASLGEESARSPELAHDGADAWVVYESAEAGGTTIVVGVITDEPDPIGVRWELAETGYAGDVDVQIHAEAGYLWVTWVESETEVGWREFDFETEGWGGAGFEEYGEGGVADARERVRGEVVGS